MLEMDCHYQFIINPVSGPKFDISLIDRLGRSICASGGTVRPDFTCSLAHTKNLVDQAESDGAAAIIISGGDGTIRSVIDSNIISSDIPIVIIPTGTLNLLARELGFSRSIKATMNALLYGKIKKLDIGLVNNLRFISVAGIGFDAEVIRRIHQQRAGHITRFHYLKFFGSTLWRYRFPHIFVKADDQIICDEPALVLVGNISSYAGNLRIHPYADCSDGLLDVFVYKCNHYLQFLVHLYMTILGKTDNISSLVRCRCHQIYITSPQADVPVHLDGDPGPGLPLNIKVIPRVVKFLIPPQ